jgi:hypothetical protein
MRPILPLLFLLPILQAVQVYECVVAFALAGLDHGVLDRSVVVPAELALDFS